MAAILKINMAAIPMLKIFLTGLVQNISFATEMNFLSLLVLEIRGKPCFWKAAILKSKMEDGCMRAP